MTIKAPNIICNNIPFIPIARIFISCFYHYSGSNFFNQIPTNTIILLVGIDRTFLLLQNNSSQRLPMAKWVDTSGAMLD